MTEAPPAEMIARACAGLVAPKHELRESTATEGTGLFAIYGDAEAWLHLGLGTAPAGAALYVGKAEEPHFPHGRTAQSTLRRSFAALLRDHLALRGIPRNPRKPERFDSYGLSEEQDATLTEWMNAHLEIAAWEKPPECAVLGDVEVAVLKRWSPPLNLRDSRSTWGARVSSALKLMAADAREWARERGHRG